MSGHPVFIEGVSYVAPPPGATSIGESVLVRVGAELSPPIQNRSGAQPRSSCCRSQGHQWGTVNKENEGLTQILRLMPRRHGYTERRPNSSGRSRAGEPPRAWRGIVRAGIFLIRWLRRRRACGQCAIPCAAHRSAAGNASRQERRTQGMARRTTVPRSDRSCA